MNLLGGPLDNLTIRQDAHVKAWPHTRKLLLDDRANTALQTVAHHRPLVDLHAHDHNEARNGKAVETDLKPQPIAKNALAFGEERFNVFLVSQAMP